MKSELVDAVVRAIDALIADELAARDPGRYRRAAKLCGKASEVLQMAVTRVADVHQDTDAIYMTGDDFGPQEMPAIRAAFGDQGPFCVHDWMVPPAEEMLALHVLLQLPGHENYLRHLEGEA